MVAVFTHFEYRRCKLLFLTVKVTNIKLGSRDGSCALASEKQRVFRVPLANSQGILFHQRVGK